MKFNISHTTRYTYSQPLLYSVQTLHLWPASGPCQTVEQWGIRTPGTLHAQLDGQGNQVHSFSLVRRPEAALQHISVVAKGQVTTHGTGEFVDTGPLHPAFFLRSTPLAEPHPRMAMWALQTVPALMVTRARSEQPTAADLVALASAVADKVQYRQGSTGVETTALEAFDWELGVCQDQAHVMVAVCRSIGLPARYVSGYFFAANAPELASHAWVDVCIHSQENRWISLDVTHRCTTDERHIRLAAATDYTACLPIKGLRRGGGEERMDVSIRIEPLTG
ncbi:MAG: transglutaminase family protein [Hydrogenophaga sp.]|jgi:transglutaminase-like putative cysteine protease|uniref:transglutaminase family protein n=1 Tax=Hydrogenophaga sp. TaxID=1904254 RepID=UPI002735C02A|nr:transglutaminase family protein [Hydrogenophaga sp.]MDP3347328.1 transglutaminase family protein [Hydrogenophaga sp.]MDP3809338.1 transglutaminase family protein [Hydrogenophaga sp.]